MKKLHKVFEKQVACQHPSGLLLLERKHDEFYFTLDVKTLLVSRHRQWDPESRGSYIQCNPC